MEEWSADLSVHFQFTCLVIYYFLQRNQCMWYNPSSVHLLQFRSVCAHCSFRFLFLVNMNWNPMCSSAIYELFCSSENLLFTSVCVTLLHYIIHYNDLKCYRTVGNEAVQQWKCWKFLFHLVTFSCGFIYNKYFIDATINR